MFLVYGHDNDLYFFDERDDVRRCESCGQLLNKWEEDLTVVPIPRKLKLDVSASYDGVVVVSRRFRELYERTGMAGLRFTGLSETAFAVQPDATVKFDTENGDTRFSDRCDDCGQYETAVCTTEAFQRDGNDVSDMGFARSDLEFGSGDEKSPLIICGDSAARILRKAKLKGLELEKVSS
jgi:hypothetical protein